MSILNQRRVDSGSGQITSADVAKNKTPPFSRPIILTYVVRRPDGAQDVLLACRARQPIGGNLCCLRGVGWEVMTLLFRQVYIPTHVMVKCCNEVYSILFARNAITAVTPEVHVNDKHTWCPLCEAIGHRIVGVDSFQLVVTRAAIVHFCFQDYDKISASQK